MYKGQTRTVGYVCLAEPRDPSRSRAASLYLLEVSRKLVRDVVGVVDSTARDHVFDETENLQKIY